MDSEQGITKQISEDAWSVPVIGIMSNAEFRKFGRLLHELGRRNIFMRYKYIARFYPHGMLEQIVDLLNSTSGKRKRSNDRHLPNPKRQRTDDSDSAEPEMNDKQDEDSATLSDDDFYEGDSSDEAEDDDDDDDEHGEVAEDQHDDSPPNPELLAYLTQEIRHHVSVQTNVVMVLNRATQTENLISMN